MAWGKIAGIAAARESFESKKKSFGRKHAEVVGPYVELGRAYLNFGRRATDTSKTQSLTVAAQIFEQCFILSRSLRERKSACEPLSQTDQSLMKELSRYSHYFTLFSADCHNLLGDFEKAEAICVEALGAATQQHDMIGSSQNLIEVLNTLWDIEMEQGNRREACFCLKRSIELALKALGKDSSGFARQMANIGDSFFYMSEQQKEHEDPDCYLECALACYKHSLPNLDHNEQDVARFGAGGRKSVVAGRIDSILKRVGHRQSNSKITTIEHVVAHLFHLNGDLNSESFLQRFDRSKTCQVAGAEQFGVSSFSHVESQLCQESETAKGVGEKVHTGQMEKSLMLGSRVRVQCDQNLGAHIVGTCIELSQNAITIGLSCGREMSVPKREATVVEKISLITDFRAATGLSRDRVHVLGPKLNQTLEDDPGREPTNCAAEEVLELCFGIIEHAQACMSLSMEVERAEFSTALDCGYWGLGLARAEGDQDLTARALNCLGNAFDGLRMYQHAKGKYTQALAVIEQSWLSAIPRRAVPTHANLSITLFKLGEFSEGEAHFRKGHPELGEAEVQKHLQTSAKGFHNYGTQNARGSGAFCLCKEKPREDLAHSMLFMGRLHQAGVMAVPGFGKLRDQQLVQLCGLRNKPELNGVTGKVQGFAEGALAVAIDASPGRVVKVKPEKLRVLDLNSRFAKQPQSDTNLNSESGSERGLANERGESRTSQQTRTDGPSDGKPAAGSQAQRPEQPEQAKKGALDTPAMHHQSAGELKHGRDPSQGFGVPEQLSKSRSEAAHGSDEAAGKTANISNVIPSSVREVTLEPGALVPGVRVQLQNLKKAELNGEVGELCAEKDGRYHVRLSSGKDVLVKAENCTRLRRAVDDDASPLSKAHEGWMVRYLAIHTRARELTNYKGKEQVQARRETAESAMQAWAEFRRSREGEGEGDHQAELVPSVGMLLACLAFDSLFSLGEHVESQGLEALAGETAAHAEIALDQVQRLGGYLDTATSSVSLSILVSHHGRVVAPAAGPGVESLGEVRLIEGTPFQLWSTYARAWVLNWRSSALHKLGDYGKALTFAEAAATQISALKTREMQSAANPVAQHVIGCQLNVEVACDHNLARSYRRCGKVQQAIDVTKEILDKIGVFEAQQPKQGQLNAMTLGLRAMALMNLGAFHYDMNEFHDAAACNKQALDLCARHPDAVSSYRHFESVVLGNQGNALSELGHLDEAQAHRRKAIQRLEPHAGEKAARASLARIKCAAASALPMQDEEAVQELEAAYAAAKSAEEAVLIPTIALSLAQRVRAVHGRRSVARAEELLQEGLEVCEGMQGSLAAKDELRIAIFDKQQRLYTQLQRLLVFADRPHDALCAAERGKGRALAHLLQPHSGDPDSGSQVSWASLQALARAERCTVLFFSMVEANEVEPAAIWSWVLSEAGELLQFQATSLSRESEYQVQAIPEEARDAFAGARGSWCGVAGDVTRGRVSVKDDSETARLGAMYDLLLKPVAGALPPTGEVLIIPHQQLFMVPWAALIDANKRFLVESFAIRLSPSLRIAHAARLFADRLKATSKKIFVGNPWPIPSSLGGLAALPFAESEVRLITQELAARGCQDTLCATGADATKERVRSMTADAGWVHLACHGLLEEKALVLAGGDCASSLLTMEEVQEAGARLAEGATVVLSACNSGCGEICGEGVVGLARSFLAAGASAALVSLWHIPDKSTMAFMLGLYRRLQAGMHMPQATRMAMLSMSGRAPVPAQASHGLFSWTSENGRAEQSVVETLFNSGKPLTWDGKPLAVGSGLTETGHLTSAAHQEIFGAPTDLQCRKVWGWNGAARAKILAADTGVLQEALGSTVCSSGSPAMCSHVQCARQRRPSQGLLLVLHLHGCGASEAAAVTPPWLDETILLIQEQLSLRFGTEDDGPGTQHTLPPKHWSPFVLVGASTSWPPHMMAGIQSRRQAKVLE